MCGLLALAGAGNDAGAVGLAWGYVALRVAHSLVQATVNRVKPRFLLFMASSACLVLLTILALVQVF